jgi:hypothetical protein
VSRIRHSCTNEDGTFSFENVPAGNILVLIHSQGFQDGLYPVAITAGNMLDLGTITLEEDQSIEQQSSIIRYGKRF